MDNQLIQQFIKNALTEDVGDGDHSSLACIPISASGKAKLLVKDNGIIAGVEFALKGVSFGANYQNIRSQNLAGGRAFAGNRMMVHFSVPF